MSIVDPLATLEWEVSRLLRSAPEKERNSLQSTVLRGNLYVTVSHKPLRHYEQVGTLFRISADDLSSWEQLPPLPSAFSGLATYRSHLVLVGGVDLKYQDEPTMATNKVWCSPDGVQPWQSLSIPPMPKTEYCPAVASVGSGGGTPVVEAAAGVVASVGSGGTPAEAAAGVVASVGSGGTLAEAAAGVVASVGSGGTPAAVGVVASVGSGGTLVAAECLIVVGEDEDTWLSSVTVFRGQQWVRLRGFLAEGLSSDVTCTCLNGNLYIAASCTAGYEPESYSSIFWCSVRELVKECEKRELAATEGEEEEEEEEEEREASKSLWHRFALPGRSGGRSDVVLYDLVSLGGEHLVVTCRNLRGNGSIHAFSALTQTWAKVGSLFDDGSGAASVDMTVAVSSQGELLVARDRRDLTIFKGSLHGMSTLLCVCVQAVCVCVCVQAACVCVLYQYPTVSLGKCYFP